MTRWSLRQGVAVLTACVALAGSSCTDPVQRSFVSVWIDADSDVRGRVLDVEALLEVERKGGEGYETRLEKHYMPGTSHKWPMTFSEEVLANEVGGHYQLTAIGRNAQNAVVAQARIISLVERGRNLELRLQFEASCFNRNPPCGHRLTCSGGECLNAADDVYATSRPREAGPAAADGGTVTEPSTGGVVEGMSACGSDGARACSGFASRSPLVCRDGAWHVEPECAEDERCDTANGPMRGSCRPIAQECMNKTPDTPFCDADEKMLVCKDLVAAVERSCGANERCVPDSDGESALCDCRPGFVHEGNRCVEAVSCARDNGGCDPMTKCMTVAGKRECTDCPPGFTGNGEDGCSPLLTGLVPSTGALSPAFSPDRLEYTLQVPMLVQRVGFTATAPSGARIALNGSMLGPEGAGSSQVLKSGTSMVEFVVSSERGVPAEYRVAITRTVAQEAYLKANRPGESDHFGYAFATYEGTMVTSAWYESGGATGVNGDDSNRSSTKSGAAYVFERKNGTWTQTAYIKPNDTSPRSFFGTSLALWKDTLAVGAFEADPELPAATRPGSVYIFTRKGDSWEQRAKILPMGGSSGDGFGTSVALEEGTLVVGAQGDDSAAENGGAAFVYEGAGETWTMRKKLVSNMPSRGATFGTEAVISGNVIAIAAQEESASISRGGGVYVFERSGGDWGAPQRLQPPRPIEDATFGFSLAISGKTIVVGAPRGEYAATARRMPSGEVYVFERGPERWEQTALLKPPKPAGNDYYGWSVDVNDAAILVGAPGDHSGGRGLEATPGGDLNGYSGAAYLYAREGKSWTPNGYWKASNAEATDGFGYTVALSNDAAFITAIYEDGGARGVNGNQNDDSSPDSGAVYVIH